MAACLPARGRGKRPPRILLRNGWQSVNIGDIAHPVGALTLIEQYLPDAEVRLWPGEIGNGVAELLARRFPKLVILGADAVPAAIRECDFLLHGSSSGFSGCRDVARWRRESGGKPYGVLGISLLDPNPEALELLSGAAFVFFRESVSLKLAKDKGVTCPLMAFGPDTAFGVTDIRDDAAATAFLAANGLEEGKFLCCIPRYRWTPYWLIKKGQMLDPAKDQQNQAMKEHDHAPLREAIAAVVRETDLKVLVCPEDMTQVALGREMVYDRLPADVKQRAVWRDRYWLTDEALSTYVRSAGLFGNEMHSPILCVANGVPAIVCRFREQTVKGFMWRDIGLDEWLFDLDDEAALKQLAPTALAMAKDPAAARAKAAKARERVRELQRQEMAALKNALEA